MRRRPRTTNGSSIKSDANDRGGLGSEWKRMNTVVTGLFTLLIIAGVPVIFRDYYFDILSFRYRSYCAVAILVVVVMLIVAIVYDSREKDQPNGRGMGEVMEGFGIKPLPTPDWAIIYFFLAAAISTFQSEYLYKSFWGNKGGYCGLLLVILYTVSFFLITKCLRFKQWYSDIFLIAGTVVCIVRILHYFQYDPSGFKVNLVDKDYKTLVSTISNINTYTSSIALLMGTSSVLFAVEANPYRKVWYFICFTVSLFSLITGINDNAYLALATLYGFLPLYFFSNLKGFKHYMLMLVVLFSEFRLIDFLTQKTPDYVMEISGLFSVVSGYRKLAYIVIALWLMIAALYVLNIRTKNQNTGRGESSIRRYIWLAIIVTVVLSMAFVLYDVSVRGNTDRYDSLSGYLLFSDG